MRTKDLSALGLLLLLAGCVSIPDSYAPPIQRQPVYGPEGTELKPYVAMNDPYAELHIAGGVSKALEGGTWRWTSEKAELKFAPAVHTNQKLRVEFAVAENTFPSTGPITLTLTVNGKALDKVRYDSAGQKRFEKPVPSAWMLPSLENFVVIEVDKPWVSPKDGAKLGVILLGAGFVE